MKLYSLSSWLFYSLELLSISLIGLVLFGRQMLSRLRWGGSKLKWASLRPSSDSRSQSWEWLSQWTNKWKGWANAYWVAGVSTFALVAFASVPLKHLMIPAPTMVAYWWFFPHVPEMMPDNEYIVLHLDRSDPLYGTRSRYTFCANGQPVPIDEGEMLKEVVYKERGDCKELVHYNFERDEHLDVKHYAKEAKND